MQFNELKQPSKQTILEGLRADNGHTFSDTELQAIAEAINKFDHNQQSMTVKEAIEWLDNL